MEHTRGYTCAENTEPGILTRYPGRRCDPAYRSGGVPSSLQAVPATKVAGSCSKVRLTGLLVSIPAGERRNRRKPVLSSEPAVSTAGRSPGVLNPPGDRAISRVRGPDKTLMCNRQAHRRSTLYRAHRAYAGGHRMLQCTDQRRDTGRCGGNSGSTPAGCSLATTRVAPDRHRNIAI